MVCEIVKIPYRIHIICCQKLHLFRLNYLDLVTYDFYIKLLSMFIQRHLCEKLGKIYLLKVLGMIYLRTAISGCTLCQLKWSVVLCIIIYNERTGKLSRMMLDVAIFAL